MSSVSSQRVLFLNASSPQSYPATANTLFAGRSMALLFTFGLREKAIAGGSTERSSFVRQTLAAFQTGSFQARVRRNLLTLFFFFSSGNKVDAKALCASPPASSGTTDQLSPKLASKLE